MTELPEGWTWATIGEVCEKPKYGWTTAASDVGEVKLLRTTDLTHGPITWETVPFCKEIPKAVAEYEVHPNDIFISRAGSVGVSVLVKDAPYKSVFASYLIRIRPTKSVNAKYLSLFLQSPHYWSQVSELSSGIALANINATKIQSMTLPLPPIEEQQQIVELLEDYLSRLDTALADVKQAKVKAAQFRRSLLQAGLNGFFSNGPKNEVSGLPKTWRIKTLADVAHWTSGGTPSSKDSALYGGDIPWIVIGDLTEGVVLETEKKITQKGLDSSSAKKLPAGTVMVAMYGASIGRTGVMGKEMTTNQAIACGTPKSQEIMGKYLLYFLQSQKNEFIAAGKGGAQPNISQGVVKSWQIALPPLEEQLKIIDEIDNQLERLAQANRATDALMKESSGLRSSLLQAAFTGQLTKEVVSV